MKIYEINHRMNELQNSMDLLNAIKKDYIEQEKDEIFIKALDDGIRYISIRLDNYNNADWIMEY